MAKRIRFKVGPKLVKEMIERDVNHPSIIIWSNGNEGGWNYNLDPLFAKYDKLQKRHMVHPWPISMIWTPTIIPLI